MGANGGMTRTMSWNGAACLRVLIQEGSKELVDEVARTLTVLGHEVIDSTEFRGIGSAGAGGGPDVAVVVVESAEQQALELIGRVVKQATCPVVAILPVPDPAFISAAAKLGIFASVAHGGDPGELQSAIDIAVQRFADYHGLEAAFERRAVVERAKGILMERHCIGQEKAFALLREQARRTNHKLIDIAEAVLATHGLLPGQQNRRRTDTDEAPSRAASQAD